MMEGLFYLLITIAWCILMTALLIPAFGRWLFLKPQNIKLWISARLETLFKDNSFPVE